MQKVRVGWKGAFASKVKAINEIIKKDEQNTRNKP